MTIQVHHYSRSEQCQPPASRVWLILGLSLASWAVVLGVGATIVFGLGDLIQWVRG